MAQMGLPFETENPDLEEVLHVHDPVRTALENAEMKNRWCHALRPDAWIIAADTVLDFEGRCIGKPRDLADAARMLESLSGRTHGVITGTAMSGPGLQPEIRTGISRVTFRALNSADIRRYLAAVDPLDKAGAYDINDHGDLVVEGFEGSRSNVMGLPAEIVSDWLRRTGIPVLNHGTE